MNPLDPPVDADPVDAEPVDPRCPNRRLVLRFGRARRVLRRLPRRRNVHRYPVLRWFGEAARSRPYLWSFRAPQVRLALWAGSIIALQPIYGAQILVALLAALLLRANLPLTVGLQALTNPLTAAPAYYLAFRVGEQLLRVVGLSGVWAPWTEKAVALVAGGLLLGVAVAALLDLAWRFAVWESARLRAHRTALTRQRAESALRRGPALPEG